jgi:hypothetical protein
MGPEPTAPKERTRELGAHGSVPGRDELTFRDAALSALAGRQGEF